MILTEDKTYTISLETEDNSSDSVLINKTIELEFSNRELLHSIHYLRNADPEADDTLS